MFRKFLRNRDAFIITVVIVIGALIDGGLIYARSHFRTQEPNSTNQVNNPTSPGATSNTSPQSTQADTSSPYTNQSQNNSKSTSSSKTDMSKYRIGSCTSTPIPYQTSYINDPTIAVGTQYTDTFGLNGSEQTCTPDSNGIGGSHHIYPPTNKVVRVGTKPATTTTTPPSSGGISLYQAQSNCARFSNTSAYEPCMHAYGY